MRQRWPAGHRPRARFVVVGAPEGAAEEAYLSQLRATAASLGISDRLLFAGARRDMPAVFQALDVFVLSSRHEGFGRVVAEAMAAGIPSVVTREGALPELVTEGTTRPVRGRDRCPGLRRADRKADRQPRSARGARGRGAIARTEFRRCRLRRTRHGDLSHAGQTVGKYPFATSNGISFPARVRYRRNSSLEQRLGQD